MDLHQSKLTKAEWETIERPVSESEKKVLTMIMKGYVENNIRHNDTKSFFSFTKIEKTPEIEYFIFKKYFQNDMEHAINKYGKGTCLTNITEMSFMEEGNEFKRLKSSDSIRIQNAEQNIENNKKKIFEYILIDLFVQLIRYYSKKKENYIVYLYTLIHMKNATIDNINKFVLGYIDKVVKYISNKVSIPDVLYMAYELIEQNKYLIKYSDMELYSHQKKIFQIYSSKAKINNSNDDVTNQIQEIEKKLQSTKTKMHKWIPEDTYMGDDDEERKYFNQKKIEKKELQKVNNSKYEAEINELMQELNSLYTQYKSKTPSLVLYTAPTGTGKTLTPIGLATNNRIIFVCVARHIGMALAKSAISMEKKVAFGFGCTTSSDIRLHYFSAIDYTIHRKSGGIGKVDHSNGKNVEIMICDVKSYLTCMHYMLAFNDANDIITYWDEPTITMDYEHHEMHSIIQNNWSNNKIPHLVLSCATLPTENELQGVFEDFQQKFEDADIFNISSFDCKKTIPILNKEGYCVLPHYLHDNYEDLITCARFCLENQTLLRYFDLREIVRFIKYIHEKDIIDINDTFHSIEQITMKSLKEYYLQCLLIIEREEWPTIYEYMKSTHRNRFDTNTISKSKSMQQESSNLQGKSLKRINTVFESNNTLKKQAKNTGGLLATTNDAYTFTDGPTIYLTDDIDRVAQFYIQQSKIDPISFDKIMKKIEKNKITLEKIDKLEKVIRHDEESLETNDEDGKSGHKRQSGRISNESQKLMNEINKLRKEIVIANLDAKYIPNTKPHQEIWAPNGNIVENAFVSDLGEENVKEIMNLQVENNYKVLILLGIGTFKLHKNARYMEIMKNLADEQKLFMIIASTDYIYGTNYQFCHGFIGKDLLNSTQQKIYQAMGRIGRNNIQQDYTIRFRDNDIVNNLFKKSTNNLELINMCKLFTTSVE